MTNYEGLELCVLTIELNMIAWVVDIGACMFGNRHGNVGVCTRSWLIGYLYVCKWA